MTDRELLTAVLESATLPEKESEAFADMAQWLDGREERELSPAQRQWVTSVASAKSLLVEETQNLYSAGLVPRGIVTRKSRGEEFAASLLKLKPTRPPGRSA